MQCVKVRHADASMSNNVVHQSEAQNLSLTAGANYP